MESWKQRVMNSDYHSYNHQRRTVRSKLKGTCKKHPKHEQSPGVCSICLTHKLLKLSETPSHSNVRKHRLSSSSSYLSDSSYDSSVLVSPTMNFTCHYVDVLKKSRSVASVLHRRKGNDRNEANGNNNKRHFWSKILFPRRNHDEGSMRSRTARETSGDDVAEYHFGDESM